MIYIIERNHLFFFECFFDFESLMSLLTFDSLLFPLGFLQPKHPFLLANFLFKIFFLTLFFAFIDYKADIWTQWRECLKHEWINLNLSACFKGYLLRSITSLNKCRFHMGSYSPVTTLIAEHLTEVVIVTSFSGQLIYPHQLIIFVSYNSI